MRRRVSHQRLPKEAATTVKISNHKTIDPFPRRRPKKPFDYKIVAKASPSRGRNQCKGPGGGNLYGDQPRRKHRKDIVNDLKMAVEKGDTVTAKNGARWFARGVTWGCRCGELYLCRILFASTESASKTGTEKWSRMSTRIVLLAHFTSAAPTNSPSSKN